MDNPEGILVIILSITLAIFLLLGIIVLVRIIQVVNHARHIASRVEDITDKAGNVIEAAGKAAPALTLGKLVTLFTGRHKEKDSKSAKEDNKDD